MLVILWFTFILFLALLALARLTSRYICFPSVFTLTFVFSNCLANVIENDRGFYHAQTIAVVVFDTDHTELRLNIGTLATIWILMSKEGHIWLEDKEAKLAGVTRLHSLDLQVLSLACR